MVSAHYILHSNAGISTTAFCTSFCLNGGTCVWPDVCECVPGWTGAQCETGVNGVHISGVTSLGIMRAVGRHERWIWKGRD